MNSKGSIAIGLSIIAIFSLGGCIAKSVKVEKKIEKKSPPIKVSYATTIPTIYKEKRVVERKRALPTSTQVCVGDSCKASIIGRVEREKGSIVRPFGVPKPPVSKHIDIATYTPKIYSSPKKTAIQVGAFRRYAGAKVYAKRYGLLSRRYKTVIKRDIKDARPLYRVRIEGFSNIREAKQFMARYSLSGAFLVRR